MDSLSHLKEQFSLEKPVIISNLMLFPVVSKTPSKELDFMTLNEGMPKGSVSVSEANDSYRWVKVGNSNQDKDLFIIDGEGLTGGMQNRIAALSIIINKNQSKKIPAFCSEKYRWRGPSDFESSNTIAYPTIRKINTRSKSFPDKSKDSQSTIWEEIERKSNTLKTHSPSLSMQSIYQEKQNELDKFKDYKPQKDQIGFLAATQKRLLCLDIFYNTDLFVKVYQKLLMSYAIDGLEDFLYGEGSFHTQKLQAFFQSIFAATLIKHVKKYQEYRYKMKQGFGKALIRNKQLIHATFFQDDSVT